MWKSIRKDTFPRKRYSASEISFHYNSEPMEINECNDYVSGSKENRPIASGAKCYTEIHAIIFSIEHVYMYMMYIMLATLL